MTQTIKNWVGVAIVAMLMFVTALMIGLMPSVAKANPSQLPSYKPSASASTTLAYMTPGFGSTTALVSSLTYDSFSGTDTKFDHMIVAYQVTATSTGVAGSVILNFRIEDSRNGIDWYARNITAVSTSTSVITSNPYNLLSLVLGTSTATGPGGSAGSNYNRIMGDFEITPLLRWVRLVPIDPQGGGNYGLYVELNPIREKQ